MNTGIESRGGQTEHWDRNDSRGDFRVARAAPNLSLFVCLCLCLGPSGCCGVLCLVLCKVLCGALLGVVQVFKKVFCGVLLL